MLNPTDYQITEEIYTSLKRIVYRGMRLSDQLPVILKCFGTAYPTPVEIARLKHEYEITKNLSLSGIIKPLTLLTDSHNPILILEDMGGLSLKKYLNRHPLELGEFLKIAIQLTQTLGELHQSGIIHKDIKPSNIILNPDTFEVKLTDFAIASQLTRENPTISHPNLLEGSLVYMSPEQTGRMNRSIDYRTDFYSLGVTFYEMLTGQLPCDSDDSMELVHCHIARIPVPPNQINLQIPQVVSDIIMKLLAKTAEDRYQSGFGLKIDLEKCFKQWQEKGEILEFALATQDFSGQLQIPQKLYGRERELARLLVAFERVCSGKTEMMLVSGYSGIGKSALVQEIQKPLVRHRGYFISGKFDQFKRNIPYSSLIQAFSELMRQLLTESYQQIQTWKEKMLTALGSNGQVIIDVIPELELIIGKQPPVPQLGATETQNRFNLFLKKFIHVFTQKEHPLVLFLDDLQWADLASLKLIQLLMTEPDSKYLLLIGAYRDNEVDATHPFMMTLDEIQKSGALVNKITLQPLELTYINQLIAETLNCTSEKSKPLAELVLNKTNGNPFFLTQLLKSLHQENLLKFDFSQGVWQWDIDRLKTVGITDNVIDLMISQIQKLSEETQNILKLAACIGNRFNLEVLAVVHEKSITDTAAELWQAVQAGLILSESNADKILVTENESGETLYKFLHDRVQQAAYSLIPDSQKKAVHLKIGQLLLKNTPPDKREEKIFDIVNQLNFSTSLITEQSERDELAGLNLIAGKKAKLSVAYQPALNYLQIGIELLATDSWQQQYNLTLSLYEEAAETAYLNADFALTERFVEAVLSRAKTVLDKVKVYEVIILAYIAQGKYIEAINIGLEVLDLLGIKLPKQPSKFHVLWGLLRTKLTLGRKSIASLVDLPIMTAPYPKAAMRILSKTVPATYLAAPLLYLLIVFKLVSLSLKWGNTSESCFAYSCYGLILCGIVGDIETGSQFGQLALNLVSRLNAREVKTKTELVVHSFIKPWIEPVKETLNPLQEAYAVGLETGDLEFAAYSAYQYCYHAFLSGSELAKLESELATYSFTIRQRGQEASADMQEMFSQVLLNFLGEAENSCALIGKVFDERIMLPILQSRSDRNGICFVYFNKLMLCFLFGEYTLAVENASAAEDYLDSIPRLIVTNFYFYDSLARLAVAVNTSPSERKNHIQKVLGNQKKIKKWVHYALMNNLHKYDLVEAEYCRVCGKHYRAIDYYDRAIEGAAKNGYIHEEALANELAAKFYLSLGKNKIAKTYMTEAHSGYIRWGAVAKVKDLESRYPDLIPIKLATNSPQNETIADSTLSRTTSHTNLLDLTTVLKASQAIASEIDLDNLLAKLMKIVLENAGAQSGVLLLNQEGQLFIEAAGTIEPDQILVRESIPVDGSDLPLSIINYVARTQEDVVLNEASEQGKFINDPYVIANHSQSILCTPILSQGKLIGILYLENNLIAAAFTQERSQLLKLLCSQAAISLENAQLYEAQKEYAKTLERQVEERTQELQQQKALFDAFFAAANAGFIIYDKELRYVQVNEAIAEMNGMPAADHIGRTLREVVPHIAPIVEPTFQQILATGEPVLNVEVSGETASQPGVELHWLVSYFPLSGLDGKPIGVGVVLVEISDRKRAEAALQESERVFRAIFNGALDAMTIADDAAQYVDANPAACQLFGMSKDQLLKAKISDFKEPGIDFPPIWQHFLEQGQMAGEFRLCRPDGTVRDVEFSATANFIPHRHLSVLRDISDRKQAEAALQKAKETADAASRAKGEFLSKMSHELRTPLNAILGFSQILNRNPSLTSQQQEYLGIINRAGEHLLNLINDVLEMSKIEAGRIELNENTFDLYRLLNSLEEMFQLKAESKDLQLNFTIASEVPQYVKTDESKLRQVLINLLGNAIKFTSTGSVTLRVKLGTLDDRRDAIPTGLGLESGQERGPREREILIRPLPLPLPSPFIPITFEVEDTGPGIAPEEIDNLFEPFVQTETGKKSQSGTGLGLPISRQFVQLMGGEITVSSNLNRGTIFQFDIQISLPEATEIPTTTATTRAIALEPDQPVYRILVVEDQPENRLLLVNLLSQLGFEVREAVNGQEAVTLTASWQPHLIWMDMQMPVMDGYEATRQIRAKEKQSSKENPLPRDRRDAIPTDHYPLPITHPIIIALTANAFAEYRATVLAAGCDDFVSKPFREEVIFEKIAYYLGIRYIYEKPVIPSVEKPKAETTSLSWNPQSLPRIPPDWMAQIHQAATELDDELVGQLSQQIHESHPLLANTLTELAKKLRFDKIIEVLGKLQND